jgi:hypothetical protein
VFIEWDPRKESGNRRKHGVSFVEAATVFDDPLSMTYPDSLHSENEERHLIIGASQRLRVLVVSHSDNDETVRIISARPATQRERRFYEEQKK